MFMMSWRKSMYHLEHTLKVEVLSMIISPPDINLHMEDHRLQQDLLPVQHLQQHLLQRGRLISTYMRKLVKRNDLKFWSCRDDPKWSMNVSDRLTGAVPIINLEVQVPMQTLQMIIDTCQLKIKSIVYHNWYSHSERKALQNLHQD